MKNLLTASIFLISFTTLTAQHNLGTGNLSSCSETIYDDGGSGGNYAVAITTTEQYCSDAGNCISITFSSFALENNWDFLKIYDGPNTSSPQIGPAAGYTGTSSPGTVNSSTGCLTFELISDVSNALSGYEATISCAACPTCDPPSALGTTTIGGFDATLNWTENGTATAWDIELGTTGFVPTGTPTTAAVSSNPYYHAGLSSLTSYDYYVRANCGGLTSTWVGPFSFTTTALPPGSTCGDPLILTLPFSQTNMNTAGLGDNYDNTDACGSSYLNGNDYVMTYTPAADECITINISNMSDASNGSLFLMDACPDAGATCMAMQRGGFITAPGATGNPDGLTDVLLTGGTTYYIVVSSDPWGSQTMTFDLDITGGPCPTCSDGIKNGSEVNIDCGGPDCAACTDLSCANPIVISALPYTGVNMTTDGIGDNYSTSACGGSYMTGNDFVYRYTATDADTCVFIALQNVSRFACGLFVLDGCPDNGATTCISSAQQTPATGKLFLDSKLRLTSGDDYYIVVSTDASNSQSFDFDINIANICPPDCGDNPAAEDVCSSAPFIANLDGFCGNTSSSYTSGDAPAGFCGTIENNSWFKFKADSIGAIIDAFVSDCINGQGIQIGIYETTDCINFSLVSNCWNPATETDGRVTATGLTIGNDYYIMVDGFDGDVCNYTIQAIGGVDVNLGITGMSNLDINCSSGKNEMTWETNNLEGVSEFHIEKSSNGKSFTTIHKINVDEFSNNYTFLDKESNGIKAYYRIKGVKESQSYSYSKILTSTCHESEISIYPNPANNLLFINAGSDLINNIQFYDIRGREVMTLNEDNTSIAKIDISTLGQGVYFVKVNTSLGFSKNIKLVKNK